MGIRIIKQPDGKYAIWENTIDDFIGYDASADDIDTFIVTKAIEKAQEEAMQLIARAEVTSTDTFKDLLEKRLQLHGQVTNNTEEDKEFKSWLTRWREPK